MKKTRGRLSKLAGTLAIILLGEIFLPLSGTIAASGVQAATEAGALIPMPGLLAAGAGSQEDLQTACAGSPIGLQAASAELQTELLAEADGLNNNVTNALITKKFDLGGRGTASGYIGVSASQKYDASKGYGFNDTYYTENVNASGSGALNDAVAFKGGHGHLKVDLPKGVYKITVTTGDVRSVTINAEGINQLYFLAGNNSTDSFAIPVTDGQLNIYATSGVGTQFSISTIEIEQTSTSTTTKPTIWIAGDETAATCYDKSENAKRGWGQYLGKYVDTNKYDIRNLSAGGLRAESLRASLFPTAEYYGKSGDILILAVGVCDYSDEYNAHPNAIDPSKYIENVTAMVRSAKAKGMKVYLVKQHGIHGDKGVYPLLKYKWFGKELEQIAKSENVGIIEHYQPWLEMLLENQFYEQKDYYLGSVTVNAEGAQLLAKWVSEQVFPKKPKTTPTPTVPGNPTVIYKTEVSGQAISNPHKGFVMTAYAPHSIDSSKGYEYGIGGPANNQAWNVSTICTGGLKWMDFNPEEGVYDWTEIDNMLAMCEKYGLTYGIRIMPYSSWTGTHADYGASHDFVPKWVYKKGAKKNRVHMKEDPSIEIDFPKWDDPIYLQACKDFAKALAAKYDGDPRVEFIDVSIFGDWGEWHNSFAEGDYMPSLEIQKEMLSYYASLFKKSLLLIPSGGWGEIYQYALSVGISKRDNGLISTPNIEWCLRPTYRANMPVVGENLLPYSMMKNLSATKPGYVDWSRERFKETIEISHLSIYAFDQDSHCSYEFYKEHKSVIDEMCNRLGYNFTVTSAIQYGNKLVVKVKNTGLQSCFFNIDLAAELTDANGKKISNFGSPIRIAKGTFHDEMEMTYEFEYKGTLPANATICLAMYESDNPLVAGKDPTVRFDNKNNLPNKKLKLVATWKAPTPTPTKKGTPTPTKKVSPTPTKKTTPTPTKAPTQKPTLTPTKAPTKKPTPTVKPPLPPSGMKAEGVSTTSVNVSWNAVSGTDGYQVWRSESSTGTYKALGTVTENSRVCVGLKGGTTYYFKVRAYKLVNGERIYSSFGAVVHAAPIKLSAPTNVKIRVNSSKDVTVSWTGVSGASGYQVWRSTSETGSFVALGTLKGTSRQCTGLKSGTTYYFKVRAYKEVNGTKIYGPFSVVAYATTKN